MKNQIHFTLFSILAGLLAGPPITAAAAPALTPAETLNLVRLIDDRQRNSGDYTSLCYVKDTERNKEPKIFQVMVYRRDADKKILIFFTKPKEEAGKGYLRIDRNLWLYDPNTGKWERRTERERIGGTNSRRADFDESRLAEEFDVAFEGTGTLGEYKTWQIRLTAKKDADVPYAVLKLHVDQDSKNEVKREEFALSGRLMRTTFYPKWIKQYSESKKADVWIPREMRIFDELEKGNSTIILIKETDLHAVNSNIFTKAWVESKSK